MSKYKYNLQLFTVSPDVTKKDSMEFKKISPDLPAVPSRDMDVIKTSYIRAIENDFEKLVERQEGIDADLKDISKKLDDLNKTLRFLAGRIG